MLPQVLLLLGLASVGSKRPHIVVIVVDDLGDLLNCRVQTAHISLYYMIYCGTNVPFSFWLKIKCNIFGLNFLTMMNIIM